MRIGFHLTPFWSPTDRAPTAIIDEAIEVVRAAAGMGFAWVSIGHHWLSHPTVWPHPIAMLGRLAPEAGGKRHQDPPTLRPPPHSRGGSGSGGPPRPLTPRRL